MKYCISTNIQQSEVSVLRKVKNKIIRIRYCVYVKVFAVVDPCVGSLPPAAKTLG